LIERLNVGLQDPPRATLISAPAGFGKTTLLGEWIASCRQPVAWLSLDEGDGDPVRFLTYLLAALQTISPEMGKGLEGVFQSPQPPPMESVLTTLLNDITAVSKDFILVLDDYHVVDSNHVDRALSFLLEHQPPHMHLVLATREDPDLRLARLRARGRLNELRAADLRFSLAEAAEFLDRVMGLSLTKENVAALETRTEGWVAGLQLAALSMQGQKDTEGFIDSFTGSHRFVLDYLVEEVLGGQPERIQTFLLRTSILSRMCGPLCDAVLNDSSPSGQETLEYLERANLFTVPVDSERRWYRYHHLFADLLRQRLHQGLTSAAGDADDPVNELHIRASQWLEDHNLAMEAFQHAAAANDIERAERLIDGKGIPLHFSGGVAPILEWLDSLPATVKNAKPSLWWRHAGLLLINGQTAGVQENLNAAEAALEAALQGAEPDAENRNLIGRIAAARATLALTRYDVEGMLVQSRRALEHLEDNSLSLRGNANWTLGFAYTLLGERGAARQAFMESISLSQAAGAVFTRMLATIGLGQVQELDNELYQAAETYRRILELVGDRPQQIISEVHLGLAHILYEWNDVDAAEQHAQQSIHLARQYESFIDRFVFGEVFLSRLKLAQGDVAGAAGILDKTDESVRQQKFVHRMPEVAAARVLVLLRQGNLTTAAHLTEKHDLPMSQARVHIARGDPSTALRVLEPWHQQVEAKGWKDEQLKTMVLQTVAYHAHGEKGNALQVLSEAFTMAEPGGFIRTFLDEGEPMAQLLSEAANQGIMPAYVDKLLTALKLEQQKRKEAFPSTPPPIEPLSQRELEVLQLIAQGLSNHEIGDRLFLALDTIKGHNRRIFDKLQVQRRTEAVARARELGLL
jgi:LuxR family maltose regulon positive regulatory protein